MKKVEINNQEDNESIDDFLQSFINESDNSDSNTFTAKVVNESLNRLFPEEKKIRELMMVSNVTQVQMVHIIKSLHSAYVLGLCFDKLGHNSVYEDRLKICEDFLRLRISINRRGRNDIVDSLKAIMLNELSSEHSKLKRLMGKA